MKLKYNLKDKTEEQTLLNACCFYQKKRIKVSTGLRVYSKTWDVAAQRCEVSSTKFTDRMNRYSRKVNKMLDAADKEWEHYLKYNDPRMRQGYTTTPHFVKHTMTYIFHKLNEVEKKEEEKKKITPLDFFKKYVDEMTSKADPRTGRFISERTQTHHRTVLHRIETFMREKYIRNDFHSFDKLFETLFEKWAYTSKNYRQNTIPATFSVLKVWLNAASKEGLITTDDYKHYRSKGTEVDNIYLNEDEIMAIYDLDISGLKGRGEIDAKSTIEVTRDLFIIGCWTGLRRSDLNHLENASFDMEKELVTIVTEKTGEKVTIPMHRCIKELWQKYEGKFPHLGNKTTAGRHLPELGRHAKINSEVVVKENRGGQILSHKYKKYQLIKFHTARRSFATNLYLKGAPTIQIMKLTGHTTEANFLKYIKITKEENAELMRKYFE